MNAPDSKANLQDIRSFLKDPQLFKQDAFINGQWISASEFRATTG
jgi:hypothetical protein